ncbi:hypothetical protein EXS65_04190 [Candidatus Peribacteria bacterium]|nr:hypothetical protein [Candidatus Peribacteria bacterium]
MKIFALETDINRVKDRFLAHGEKEIFIVTPHIFSFLIHVIRDILYTVVLLAVIVVAKQANMGGNATMIFFAITWFLFVFFPMIKAYIDWKYDFLLLTTDKLIIVEQTSLFRKSIMPISIENLGDVVAETQWLNLFRFGIIHFALKEGSAPEVVLRYMPNADKLVAKIAEQITLYQRRKDFVVPYRPDTDVS